MFALDDEHTLRPLREGDGAALAHAYRANREHLSPWEPRRNSAFFSDEVQERDVERSVRDAALGRSLRFVIASTNGEIRGRMNLNNIIRGAFWSADLGYWIDASVQGRGLARRAVALVADHARDVIGLHRLQAGTLLHNTASQRVLAANGFERIGLAPRYLEIAGRWEDHVLFQKILDDGAAASAGSV